MSGILSRLTRSNHPARPAAPLQSQQAPKRFTWGLGVFVSVIMVASVLSALRLENPVKVFLAGEIANLDITADQNLRYVDREATQRKRDQVADNQPPVFDLSPEPFEALRKHAAEILLQTKRTDEDPEKIRAALSEDLNAEISRETIALWRSQEFLDLMATQVMPWLKETYAKGVHANSGAFAAYKKQGVLLREMPSGMETLHLDGPGGVEIERVKDDLDQLLRVSLKKSIRIRKAVFTLIGPFLKPNLTFNQDTTQVRKQEIVAAVEPVYSTIHSGEMIVRQGERVTPEQQTKLQALYAHRSGIIKPLAIPGTFLLACLFFVLLHLSQGKKSGIWTVSNREWLTLATVTAFLVLLAKFVELARVSDAHLPFFLKTGQVAFGLPVAGAAGVLAMFLPQALCSFAVLLLSFLVANEVGGNLHLFSFYLLGGLVYASIIRNCETRQDVLRSILPLSLICVISWLGIVLVQGSGGEINVAGGVHALFNAVFSLLLVLGLSPVLELVFGYTSRFKLMELMSLEQPLLQELMVNAPGTYHHSIIVANMVEAAARAVGANALLAKVAALYHDIGKLKNPQYFIENQYGKENKHDKLSPSMSALILISHVKKGVELAKEHKLGDEIAALIGQHHGMTLITYFYHKAQEQAEAKGEEPVREEEFRYPGPKPQSKEAGIIMLADAIEASSRTLVDPTSSRIKGHIQAIVRKLYNEGELDGSELTLKDLTQASDTFHRILTGIFHHRIEYPNLDRSRDKPKDAGEKNAASPVPEKAA